MLGSLSYQLANNFVPPTEYGMPQALNQQLLREFLHVALSVPIFSEQQRLSFVTTCTAHIPAMSPPVRLSPFSVHWPFELLHIKQNAPEALLNLVAAIFRRTAAKMKTPPPVRVANEYQQRMLADARTLADTRHAGSPAASFNPRIANEITRGLSLVSAAQMDVEGVEQPQLASPFGNFPCNGYGPGPDGGWLNGWPAYGNEAARKEITLGMVGDRDLWILKGMATLAVFGP